MTIIISRDGGEVVAIISDKDCQVDCDHDDHINLGAVLKDVGFARSDLMDKLLTYLAK